MNKLLLYVCIGFALFKGWEKLTTPDTLEPLFGQSYVAVYGRNTCGYTQQTIADLKNKGFNYKYYTVDESDTADLLHSRMEAVGISTRRYLLPVVDVNGKLLVRPSLSEIESKYN